MNKKFQIYDITKKTRASFIPIQLDNGCNYFRKKNHRKSYQFKYLYKEDMIDFFESLGNLNIHKLSKNTKNHWLKNYNTGYPWINVDNYLAEI